MGETYKGFPNGAGGGPLQGPIDGKIASGGNPLFSALDAQSATRWHKTEITDRQINFDWVYYVAHPATKHEYFISRNGWNPNEVLKRSTFESSPFCSYDGGNIPPAATDKHTCMIPDEKSGHHVILAIWTVGDTDFSFYNAADINIVADTALPGGWNPVGQIVPGQPLLPGDKVKARAFTATGENPQYNVEIGIADANAGKPENWSFALAEQINITQERVRAGVRDEHDNIEPVHGLNKLYAQKETNISHYEIEQQLQEDLDAHLAFGNLAPEHELDNGVGSVAVPLTNNRTMNIEASIFNESNKQVGSVRQEIPANSNITVNIAVRSSAGKHGVKLVGTTLDGRTTRQAFTETLLTGEGDAQEFDFEFPNNIGEYTAGTTVLQPKNGQIYECKPFPYSGYCKQYTPSANAFEPGIGSSWSSAWDQK